MTSTFREFAQTFEEFAEKYPDHPITEEIRATIARGRYPKDEWLRARTNAMNTLMRPLWKKDSKMTA